MNEQLRLWFLARTHRCSRIKIDHFIGLCFKNSTTTFFNKIRWKCQSFAKFQERTNRVLIFNLLLKKKNSDKKQSLRKYLFVSKFLFFSSWQTMALVNSVELDSYIFLLTKQTKILFTSCIVCVFWKEKYQ